MDQKQLEAFAREAAKSIKTEGDLDDFRRMLTKVTVETALNAELDEHLGYDKHQSSAGSNSRNGKTRKACKPMLGPLNSRPRATERGALSPSWSRRSRDASPRWTSASFSSTPAA